MLARPKAARITRCPATSQACVCSRGRTCTWIADNEVLCTGLRFARSFAKPLVKPLAKPLAMSRREVPKRNFFQPNLTIALTF